MCNATYELKYGLNEDGESYSVVGIDYATVTEIVIPKFYNKKPITSIRDGAFSFCDSLKSITIPDGVTSIGSYAFAGCDSLTSITIGNSVTSIGNYAFEDCTSLTSMTIPNSVASIGIGAFAGCDSLTSVTIGNSVTSIGNNAFYNCDSLTSITIPNSVTSIYYGAFSGCSSLTSIKVDSNNPVYHSAGNCLIHTATKTLIVGCNNSVIPDDGTVTSIGDCAFEYCYSLTSITIPDGVTSIGYKPFYKCTNLTSVYYMGTASEWSKISIDSNNDDLINATIYYYSQTEPTESGNYWHFDTDGKTPIVWKKEN